MIIDPINSIAASTTAINVLQELLPGNSASSSKKTPSHKNASTADFHKLLEKETASNSLGITHDNAINLVGATVTVKNSNGSLVTGKVERVELLSGDVSLRVQGHDYLSSQVAKINQPA